MGMFDYVYYIKELPKEFPDLENENETFVVTIDYSKEVFQTKSLDKLLEYYRVTPNGEMLRMVNDEYIRWPYSGLLNFYTTVEDEVELIERHELLMTAVRSYYWIEFESLFSKGELLWTEPKILEHRETEDLYKVDV
jgi:hypothetical protein|tara:strand:- start:134 stop:544 length:411 start_codon:yes stop_codon:yes gene_type:complete